MRRVPPGARALGLAGLAVLAVFLGPTPTPTPSAFAAPPPRGEAAVRAQRAQAYVDLGTSFFKKKRYEAALAEFERAEPLVPEVTTRAVVRYNIARCLEELQRPEEAVVAFDRYLELPDEPPAQAAARQKRDRLRERFHGTLRVDVRPGKASCGLLRLRPDPTSATPTTCPPEAAPVLAGVYVATARLPDATGREVRQEVTVTAGESARVALTLPAWLRIEAPWSGATVSVDDRPFGQAPTAEGLLEPGPHAVAVQSGEVTHWRTNLRLEPGETRRIAAPLGGPADDASGARGVWPWVAAGGALAALAGGGFFYAGALSSLDQGDAAAEDMARAQTLDEYERHRAAVGRHDDDARSHRALAVGLGAAGVALVGVTAWLFLHAPGGPESTQSIDTDGASPSIDAHGATPFEVRF